MIEVNNVVFVLMIIFSVIGILGVIGVALWLLEQWSNAYSDTLNEQYTKLLDDRNQLSSTIRELRKDINELVRENRVLREQANDKK